MSRWETGGFVMRNTILVARINGLILLAFGLLWGLAQFTTSDPIWQRALMAVVFWGIGAVGGAVAWWGFRTRLPPRAK